MCHAQAKAGKESGDKTGTVKTIDGKRTKVRCHAVFRFWILMLSSLAVHPVAW